MIRLARRASLLVAFYLLTSAATAYAECAWVLWATPPDLSRYWPMGGYETKDACETRAKDENKKQLSQQVPAAHLCLPDTVDPRGPKAK